MSQERIKLKEEFRQDFFKNILSEQNFTLKQLSQKLSCGYSAIKKWKSGKSLIPENIVLELLDLQKAKSRDELDNNILAKFPENWGAKVGGDTYAHNYKNEIDYRMKYVRKFKPSPTIPKIDESVWEIIGICMGDGCLSRYFSNYEKRWKYDIIFTGNMKDDLSYYKGHLLPLLREKFHLNPKPQFRKKDNSLIVTIRSEKIFNFFKKLGVPVGKKLPKIKITNLMRSSNVSKAAILRGLFDTDGHIFARKDEGYRYPHIEISSGSDRLRKNIKTAIRELGMPAYIHSSNVLIRGGDNIKIWMKTIGSSHPTHINRYNSWLYTGKLLPKRGLLAQ